MNIVEQRDIFRELLFLDYGIEEKYITSKIIVCKMLWELLSLISRLGIKNE